MSDWKKREAVPREARQETMGKKRKINQIPSSQVHVLWRQIPKPAHIS